MKFLLDQHIRSRCNDTGCNVLPYNSGGRQDDSLSSNRTCRVPSSVPFNWECPQHHPARTSKCCGSDWISCYSQEFVNSLILMCLTYNPSLLGDRKYDNDPLFRKFKRQLYHATLSTILKPLRPGMINPVIRRCPDGYYQRVVYDLAGFIADYPEQVALAGTVSGWCPRSVLMLFATVLHFLNSITGAQHCHPI